MSLFSNFDVAGSALSAQMLRLNTISSNLANAETIASSPEEAYRSRNPIFKTVMKEHADGYMAKVELAGVATSKDDVPMRYEPGNPVANEDGYVFGSNVSVVTEMVNMMSASRSYQSNIEILTNTRQMLMKTLRLGE